MVAGDAAVDTVADVVDLIARRLGAQLLSGTPAATAESVVTRLLAVQAQDPRGARLSIRSRSSVSSVTDVDEALTTRRSLLITTLNRGTLHLVTPTDYWWLHALTTPQLATANARRLGQEGVTPPQADRGVAVVMRAVTEDGPQTRAQLRERLRRAGVPTEGQALVHVLLAASLRGHVVRGPMIGGESAFVAVPDWLGPAPPPLERVDALGRLARRYLEGHGPADARDLAKWAGITLGDARLGFSAAADDLVSFGGGLVGLAESKVAPGPLPPPRLLGPFDPLLLGWVSRAAFVGDHRSIVTTNGLFRPFAFVQGRPVATWGLAGGTITIRPLEPIDPATIEALRADGADVLRFLGLAPAPVIVASAAM